MFLTWNRDFLVREVEMKIKASEQEGLTVDAGRAMCSVRQTCNQREGAELKDRSEGLLPATSTHTASRSSCHPVLGLWETTARQTQGAPRAAQGLQQVRAGTAIVCLFLLATQLPQPVLLPCTRSQGIVFGRHSLSGCHCGDLRPVSLGPGTSGVAGSRDPAATQRHLLALGHSFEIGRFLAPLTHSLSSGPGDLLHHTDA